MSRRARFLSTCSAALVVVVAAATLVMASDGSCQGKAGFQGISLSLTVANEAEADRRFNALADGGKVQMPLTKTFFSPRFGMVADRFGVTWMVIVEHQEAT